MGLNIFLLGSLFYPILYTGVQTILRRVWGPLLSDADVFLISEKCISSLQAIISSMVGIFISLSCRENIMTDTHWITNSYAWFGLPYFMYDTWAIFNTHYYLNEEKMKSASVKYKLTHFSKNNIAMLFHHIVLPVIFFPIILYYRNNKADYFVGIFFACEAAIPFIAVRFILAQLKLKDTPAYIFFGLLMIVVFFITRILLFPFLYWKYGSYAGIPFLEVPFRIPLHCNAGCLLVFLLQMYFFYLMVRGAARVFYKMFTQARVKND